MNARAPTLDAGTTDRLIKLCGMFGSDHDGERATAARMADEIVRRRKLTWADVIAPCLSAPEPEMRWREPQTWREAVSLALCYAHLLTPWEADFIDSLRRSNRPLSTKQADVVDRIVRKIRAHAEAA